jgi:hypothetical protein
MPPLEEMVCHLIQKRTEVAVLPATEDIDHRFSEENPSGLEESQKPGAVANMALTGNSGKTLPGITNHLSTGRVVKMRAKKKTWWIPS